MKKIIIALATIATLTIGVPSGQVEATTDTPSSSIHIVELGDTLWEIAKANNVSVEDLIVWNELETTIIYPSQELKIKNMVVIDNSSYTVKRGDTLSQIAKSHNILLEDLMEWNAISSYLIFPGDKLQLEDPSLIPISSTAVAISTTSDDDIRVPTFIHPVEVVDVPVSKLAPPISSATVAYTPPAKAPAASTTIPTASYSKEMTVTATAYTAYCDGCSGTTFTGIDLRANPNQKVIAVDPNVIPLGSRVWVEGYGEAIAGDIGGAIKGNIIDVFLEHRQDALNWGRRTVKIRILQ